MDWRERTALDVLDPLPTELGVIAPERRCGVIGLERGDCKMRLYDAANGYCYYHSKMAAGLLGPDEELLYPVYPLPENGYVLVPSTRKRKKAA